MTSSQDTAKCVVAILMYVSRGETRWMSLYRVSKKIATSLFFLSFFVYVAVHYECAISEFNANFSCKYVRISRRVSLAVCMRCAWDITSAFQGWYRLFSIDRNFQVCFARVLGLRKHTYIYNFFALLTTTMLFPLLLWFLACTGRLTHYTRNIEALFRIRRFFTTYSIIL